MHRIGRIVLLKEIVIVFVESKIPVHQTRQNGLILSPNPEITILIAGKQILDA